MKLLVIAVFCVGIFFLYQMTIGAVRHSYDFCIEQALAAKTEAEVLTCGAQKAVYEELVTCIVTVQKESGLATFLYGVFGTKSEVNILVKEHNQECRLSTVKLPEEAFYLEY